MKVLVVYYSMYGHVLQLAQSVVDGVKSVAGVEAVLRRVQEFEDIERDLARHEHALAV
jgi:NAD(P)H dehydrogenase (quinone)